MEVFIIYCIFMNYFFSIYKYKNQGSCIYARMNEPREHYAKLKKADKGGQTLYVETRLVKLIEPSSNKAVTRSWVEGEMGHC